MSDYTNLKTQKQIKEYTRYVIDDIGICDDIKNIHPKYYNYLTTFLFPRHTAYPEKFINMKNIGIRKNRLFKHLEVYIIKYDGCVDDVSVMRNCVTGKKANDLSLAMRNSIYSQIKDFKDKSPELKCVDCGSINNIHIDHNNPQFIELQKNFIKSSKLDIPKNFDDNDWNGKIFRDVDNDFENEWKKYHKDNANLQPLCEKCNLTKKKSKTKFKNINNSK